MTVLRFRDSKEKLVRKAVTYLLPRLAAFSPERFARDYLNASVAYLLLSLQNPLERGAAFSAIGEMAMALAKANVAGKLCHPDYLGSIAGGINETLRIPAHKGRPAYGEALLCAGTLAAALREEWYPYIISLLDPIFSTGLNGAP